MSTTCHSPRCISSRARRPNRVLMAAMLCLLIAPAWAQVSSGFERTIAVGGTKVTCRYTVTALEVDTSRVASADGLVKCWIPAGFPGAGTTLAPSDVSASMLMYRNGVRFTGNSINLLETATVSPQIKYVANETPSTCTKGTSYAWQASFVVSFTLKLSYNGKSVSFPQYSVLGPPRTWQAASANCNR